MRSRETGERRRSLAETLLLGLAGERSCLRLIAERCSSPWIVMCVPEHAAMDKHMHDVLCSLNTDTSKLCCKALCKCALCILPLLYTKEADVWKSLQLLPVHLELLGEWAGHHDHHTAILCGRILWPAGSHQRARVEQWQPCECPGETWPA